MTWGIFIAFSLGAIGWTFAEYAIHNWVMHCGKGKNEFSRQHLNHHADPNFFAPLWEKYATEAIVVSALAGIGVFLAGWPLGLAFAAGFSICYHAYESLHQGLHTRPPRGPIGRFLRRHHMTHHFVAPMKNQSVSLPIWDVLFGSRLAPKKIVIPARHAMSWLVDPESGEIREEYSSDYGIRKTTLSGRQKELDHDAAFSNQALV